jgi:hypothetical protein
MNLVLVWNLDHLFETGLVLLSEKFLFLIFLWCSHYVKSTLVSMRIRIQLFISMLIRIQGAKPMRTRIQILVRLKGTKSFCLHIKKYVKQVR